MCPANDIQAEKLKLLLLAANCMLQLLLLCCLPAGSHTACNMHAYRNVVVFVIVVVAAIVWMPLLPKKDAFAAASEGTGGAKRWRNPKPHRRSLKPHRPVRTEICCVCPAALTCPALPCAMLLCAVLRCACVLFPVLCCTWAGCKPRHMRWWQAPSPAM